MQWPHGRSGGIDRRERLNVPEIPAYGTVTPNIQVLLNQNADYQFYWS